MNIEEWNKKDILGDFEYELNKLCQSCIGTATEIKIKQQPLIHLFEKIVWFYEKEKEKNKELIPKVEILERQNYALCEDNEELIKKSPYSKNLYLKYVETPKIEMKEYKSNEYWTDKIRAKIEVLNTNIVNAKKFDGDYIGNCRFAKYVLQSLLEKE